MSKALQIRRKGKLLSLLPKMVALNKLQRESIKRREMADPWAERDTQANRSEVQEHAPLTRLRWQVLEREREEEFHERRRIP